VHCIAYHTQLHCYFADWLICHMAHEPSAHKPNQQNSNAATCDTQYNATCLHSFVQIKITKFASILLLWHNGSNLEPTPVCIIQHAGNPKPIYAGQNLAQLIN